ncbi:MAG: winged helix-turn-helix transcriptional regulator [Pseudolabrys sp.]|nr:winged helix-turn-helix transcriptional regulator [Pseudolabrys sp.]
MVANKPNRNPPMTVARSVLLEDGSDSRFRDLLHAIFAFSSQLEQARARFAAFIGLSPAQYMILIAIARLAPQEAGIAQIAERLYLSGAFVTIEVNKLVKMGLVIKTSHPSDGRRVVLRTSAQGDQRLAALAEYQRPVNDALFASLKRQDFITLHRMMTVLSAGGVHALAVADFVEGQLKPNKKAS